MSLTNLQYAVLSDIIIDFDRAVKAARIHGNTRAAEETERRGLNPAVILAHHRADGRTVRSLADKGALRVKANGKPVKPGVKAHWTEFMVIPTPKGRAAHKAHSR